jgi:hypothetical protein
MGYGEIISIVGCVLGILTFLWRLYDEFFNSYLHIDIQADQSSTENITVLTRVINKGLRKKKISYAVLVLGPQEENPAQTVAALTQHSNQSIAITHTNDIVRLKQLINDSSVYDDYGRGVIPLPFFYSEQVQIADETLTYRAFVDTINCSSKSVYSVRFYIFTEGRLHRSTHDLFIAP